jgi:hypothetical protein
MATVANLALEGGDPRDVSHPAIHGHEPAETQLLREIHDPSITFEEYSMYTPLLASQYILHKKKISTPNHTRYAF